jgi:hypothetical protein
MANFPHTLTLPNSAAHRSPTSLREMPVKIGAKSVFRPSGWHEVKSLGTKFAGRCCNNNVDFRFPGDVGPVWAGQEGLRTVPR